MSRRMLLSVLTTVGAFAVAGCTPGATPGPTPPVTLPSDERDTPDTLSVTVPDGWALTEPGDAYFGGPNELRVVLAADKAIRPDEKAAGPLPGLAAEHYSSRSTAQVAPELVDPVGRRDAEVADLRKAGAEVRVLPDRTLDGTPAHGLAATLTGEGRTHALQRWVLRRPDGSWVISVIGRADEAEVAPELLAALDTLRWEAPR